jgi:hypothetical protein
MTILTSGELDELLMRVPVEDQRASIRVDGHFEECRISIE